MNILNILIASACIAGPDCVDKIPKRGTLAFSLWYLQLLIVLVMLTLPGLLPHSRVVLVGLTAIFLLTGLAPVRSFQGISRG
jgi:hypothetical protein